MCVFKFEGLYMLIYLFKINGYTRCVNILKYTFHIFSDTYFIHAYEYIPVDCNS